MPLLRCARRSSSLKINNHFLLSPNGINWLHCEYSFWRARCNKAALWHSSSVANLVASGCRASLQLVDHPQSMQDQAYYLCRHIIFSCMMYNEISQYASSMSTDPSPSLTLYGTVPMNRSFPYSLHGESSQTTISMEQLSSEALLDRCREQCFNESSKALTLLSTNFDQTSAATRLLRSMVEQIQKGLRTKTVI